MNAATTLIKPLPLDLSALDPNLLLVVLLLAPLWIAHRFASKKDATSLKQRMIEQENRITLLTQHIQNLPHPGDISRLRLEIAQLSQLIYTVKYIAKRLDRMEKIQDQRRIT